MLGRMIAAGQPRSSLGFVVTNDADWDAVFANNAEVLSGKTVEIRGNNFTQRAIANKDMVAAGAPLIIRSADAASSLPSIILNGTVRGIDFSGLNFQMTGWPKAAGACVVFNNGTFGALRFINGTTFRHGYGAALANIDTAAALPEYDRVDNVQTATTTSTSHALTWKDPAAPTGWIEFFNRGADSVRIAVGGPGVVAIGSSTLVAAGGRTRISSGVTPGATTHFAVLATTGTAVVNARTEIGLIEYLANAFGSSGAAVLEDVEIRNCLFRDVASGVKGLNPNSLIVMDCDFDRIYQDILSFAPKTGGFAYVLRNLECLPFARSGIAEGLNGDARDPHGDQFQMFSNGSGTIGPIFYAGNRVRVGNLRANVSSQGIFISDNDITPSYTNLYFISTMQVGGAPRSLDVGETGWPARDVLIYGATAVDWRNAASTLPSMSVVTDQGGSVYLSSAIAYNITSIDTAVMEQNVLRLSTAASPTAVFPGLAGLSSAVTREAIEAAITPAAEGAGIGAVATAGAIDWLTTNHEAVIQWANVPSGAHWNALVEQAPGTVITLPVRKILNRRAGQTVTVGGGTEWRKVAANGTTELLAWGTAPGTIEPDQFIQIRRTSGAGGSTVTAAVTINGFAQTVTIRAANAPQTFLVQGATAGRFADIANLPAATTRLTWRGRFFWPSGTLTDGQKPFSQLSLGCDLETFGNGFRVSVEDGTQAAMFNTAPVRHQGRLVANTWLDIVFDIDQVARTVTLTINGLTEVYAFDNLGNGVFNTTRRIGFVAVTSGTNPLASGVRFSDLSVDRNGVLRKAISNDAATANIDPWRLGGTFTNA